MCAHTYVHLNLDICINTHTHIYICIDMCVHANSSSSMCVWTIYIYRHIQNLQKHIMYTYIPSHELVLDAPLESAFLHFCSSDNSSCAKVRLSQNQRAEEQPQIVGLRLRTRRKRTPVISSSQVNSKDHEWVDLLTLSWFSVRLWAPSWESFQGR